MKLSLSLFMMICLTYIESAPDETPLLQKSYLNQSATEEDFEDRIAVRKHFCTEEPSKKTFVIWPKSVKPNLSKAFMISVVEKSARCVTVFQRKGPCKTLVVKCPVFNGNRNYPRTLSVCGKGITNTDKPILVTTTKKQCKVVYKGQDLNKLRCFCTCRE